jgi:hypothetical protein
MRDTSIRVLFALVLTGLLMAAVPAVAAPASNENKVVFEVTQEDALAEAEAASDYCKFDIEVTFSGWVQTKVFNAGGGDRQQDGLNVFHLDIVYSSGDRSYRVLDVGPDHTYVVDGTLFVAITGRSLTGTGIVGHVVINLDTNEAVFEAGNDRGFYLDGVCAALS